MPSAFSTRWPERVLARYSLLRDPILQPSGVLAASIVLVSILLCHTAMAAPPMLDDLQMVEPDSSLPKEMAGFWGKWEGFRKFVCMGGRGNDPMIFRRNLQFLGLP